MLSVLRIENIAVIEQADITFDRGFNVLTGETGAGKSIVIDAISAILGERAYRDMIRTGTSRASVRAVFTEVPELPWFRENGVAWEDEILIQREIYQDGKNVCRVNGGPVSVSVLRKLGLQLINIHGQRDSQQLFDEGYHLHYLDAFAGDERLLETYGQAFEAVCAIRKDIQRLTMDEGEKLRRMESLKFQIDEISRANLKPGEDEALESRRKLLQNAEKLSGGLDDAVVALYGDEDSDGAAALLAQAERALGKLGRFDPSLETLHTRVSDLMYQVQDVAEEFSSAYGISGAYVVTVEPGYAAKRAGIQPKDIIVALDDQTVTSINSLTRALRGHKAGDVVVLTVIRSGERLQLEVTLDERPRDLNGDTAQLPDESQMPSEGDYDEWYDYFRRYFGG